MAQARIKKRSYSLEVAADETTQTAAISGLNGEVMKIVVQVPNFTNTVTTTVTMQNGDELEIFASSALAKNDAHNITINRNECLVVGATNELWKITLSGAPGGTGGTVIVTAYIGT